MENFIGALVTIVFIYISIVNLADFKITKKELLIMIGITQVATIPIYVYWRFLSFIPINIIAIIFLYRKNKKPVIGAIVSLLSTLVAVISDYIVSFIRMFIIGMNFNIDFQNHIMYIIFFLADCIMIFIISKLIGILINKKIQLSRVEFKRKFGILIIVSLLLTLIIFYTNIILGSNNGFTTEIIELNGTLFLFILYCYL
ncbi:hypothetical protein DFH91_000225 [Clostridium saccharobutylicum]|uniref:hypothetical protein n=1 Tax=Clostridium saccharobutylicum TaxID=169679 RepID=UPI001F4C0665|nr:hypothetical protein [Clostridium saccharobutylicum]NOV82735.1 hypothetical protein [Clostridium saccharobutylicum]